MKILITERQIRELVSNDLSKDRKRRNSVQNLSVNTRIKNAEDTGDDNPPIGESWIGYWKLYIQACKYLNIVPCVVNGLPMTTKQKTVT